MALTHITVVLDAFLRHESSRRVKTAVRRVVLGGVRAGLAKHVPRHIRAHVLATHLAFGCPFNRRAPLGRHLSIAGGPAAEQGGGNLKSLRKSSLRATLQRKKFGELHARIISMPLTPVNSNERISLLSKPLKNPRMQRIEQIYRARLAFLVNTHGKGRQSILAPMIQKAPAQISQWINASKDSTTGKPRAMDRTTAREIEKHLKLPVGWMDQPLTPDDMAHLPPGVEMPAVEAADPADAYELMRGLALMLIPLDGTDREQAEVILRKLALTPEDSSQLASKMVKLLGEAGPRATGDVQRRA